MYQFTNKIEFIVLSCDKYLNDRVESIKNTWGKNQNVKFLIDSLDDNPYHLGYDTPKNYLGIQEKYQMFFKSYEFINDYYFFVDDDTFVNLKNLSKLVLPEKTEKFALVRLLCLNNDATDMWGNYTGANLQNIRGDNTELPLFYGSGGSGFILSQAACLAIKEYLLNTKDIPTSDFGDLSIGFWIRNSNTKLLESNFFWWDTHEKLLNNNWVKYHGDKDVVTFHYVSPEQMVIYNDKYNL